MENVKYTNPDLLVNATYTGGPDQKPETGQPVPATWMALYDHRWRRVYTHDTSQGSSAFVRVKGEIVYLSVETVEKARAMLDSSIQKYGSTSPFLP